MTARIEMEGPLLCGEDVQLERLRARVARRPGRWRRRMRQSRERRDSGPGWQWRHPDPEDGFGLAA